MNDLDPQMTALMGLFRGLAEAPTTRDEAIALLACLPEKGDNEKPSVRLYLSIVREQILARFPDVTKAEIRAFFTRIRNELPGTSEGAKKWLNL